MAWTQTQLNALEAAIAEGTLEVQYEDKKVRYRTLDEMIKIRDMIKKELGQTSRKPQRLLANFNKGVC